MFRYFSAFSSYTRSTEISSFPVKDHQKIFSPERDSVLSLTFFIRCPGSDEHLRFFSRVYLIVKEIEDLVLEVIQQHEVWIGI